MDDGDPVNNIYLNSWQGTKLSGDMHLSNWNTTDKCLQGTTPETLVHGTNYKLAFFGENHDQAATYNFPEGYHVVFFIAPLNNGTYNAGSFNYSMPELNQRINHTYGMNGVNDPTRGIVKATAWTYNGHVYMGFEDGTDDDLNDIVFWVEGDYTPDTDIPNVPSTTEPEIESWILACEDMGDTGDYDFNDIVLDVWKTDATHVAVKCLAAGGTLPANIYLKDKTGNYNFVGESHTLLGGPDTKTMLNTFENGPKYTQANPVILEVDEKWTISENYGDFKIAISYGDDVSESIFVGKVTAGTAPQMIIVPGDWEWPKEWQRIEDAYPDFENWSEDADKTGWVNNKVDEFIYQR